MRRRNLGVLVLAAAVTAPAEAGSVLFVDDDAPGGGDGATWMTALRFLADALAQAAEPRSDVSEIRVAAGIYLPDRSQESPGGTGDRSATFQMLTDVAILGGYAGLGAPDLDARDTASFNTMLSGDLSGNDGPGFVNYTENSYHVVTASGVESSAVLDGVTIRGGHADGTDDPVCFGGSDHGLLCVDAGDCPGGDCVGPDTLGAGVFCLNGRPTFADCRIVDNLAAFQGGGLLLKSASDATISGCLISGNRAGDNGGGMYLGFSAPLITDCQFIANAGGNYAGATCNRDHSDAIFLNCLFQDNTAAEITDTGGGAVVNASSSPTFESCTFIGNQSFLGHGGALYNKLGFDPILGPSNPILLDCSFESNTANYNGGAIYNIEESVPDLTNCIFVLNEAGVLGGGMYNDLGSDTTLIDCSFAGNIADSGGGMYSADCAPELTTCTFVANTAANRGGGMYNQGALAMLVDCSFTLNDSAYGGGVYNLIDANAMFTDCSFTANTATSYGGGMYNNASDSVLSGCTFNGNTAQSVGGAMYNDGVDAVSLQGCVLSNNTAGSGGALANSQYAAPPSALVSLVNCILNGNVAEDEGGAIFNNRGFLELNNCALIANFAGTDGGAIFNSDADSELVGCALWSNSAGYFGGAIAMTDVSRTVMTDCDFLGNTADTGGAFYSLSSTPVLANCRIIGNSAQTWGGAAYDAFGDAIFTNCLISGNSSADRGGGLFLFRSAPRLVNCTIHANSAALSGGGIFNHNEANPWLQNCILWGNTHAGPTDESAQIFNWIDSQPVVMYTCVQGWTGSFGGIGNFGDDPVFVDPAGSDGVAGSLDDDLRLQSGSPAIDAANTYALGPCDTDLDGLARAVDDPEANDGGHGPGPMADLGAYEFASSSPADCNGNGDPDGCDVANLVNFTSGDLGSIEAGVPRSFEIPKLPDAIVSYVVISFDVSGDFSEPTEYVTVYLNATQLGVVLLSGPTDCPSEPQHAFLVLEPMTFNAEVEIGGEPTVITMVASDDVGACGGGSLTVNVEYFTSDTRIDGDGNGIPDDCEIPGDLDGDGDVDTADLLALLGAWGPCPGEPEPCPADIDGNGIVATGDLLILLGNWG